MLTQLAHDEVVFRFESDEDRKEFCELIKHPYPIYDYVEMRKNGGFHSKPNLYGVNPTTIPTWTQIKERYKDNQILKTLVEQRKIIVNKINKLIDNCTRCELDELDYELNEIQDKITAQLKYIEWKEKREVNKSFNVKIDTKGIAESMQNCIKSINQFQLYQAISLLESNGYKVEAPYLEPTDEGICERIRHENEKAGWTADFDDETQQKCYIYYDSSYKKYSFSNNLSVKVIGATYTSIQIAETIVDELNERRFVRVREGENNV